MKLCPLVFLSLLGLALAQERRAIAVLFGSARGNVTFIESGNTVRIMGTVEGISPGQHGFHIHEKGDVSMGCASTLGHYNPSKESHGAPSDQHRHVGDLGNILADQSGVAAISMTDHLIKLSGPTSVIGRAVVVHSDADDLGKGGHSDSLTTGHAGSRIACGVIGTLQSQLEMNSGASGTGAPTILTLLLSIILSLYFNQSQK